VAAADMALVYILIVIGIFLGDQRIKTSVEKYIQVSGKQVKEREGFGGKLLFSRYHNRGAMLNLGESKEKFVAALSVVLTTVLTAVFILSLGRRGNHLLRAGLSLLLGGAFSNTYDRMKRKYVVDYVSFRVKWQPLRRIVFNLADFCIIIGAMLSALGVA